MQYQDEKKHKLSFKKKGANQNVKENRHCQTTKLLMKNSDKKITLNRLNETHKRYSRGIPINSKNRFYTFKKYRYKSGSNKKKITKFSAKVVDKNISTSYNRKKRNILSYKT